MRFVSRTNGINGVEIKSTFYPISIRKNRVDFLTKMKLEIYDKENKNFLLYIKKSCHEEIQYKSNKPMTYVK